MPLEHISKTHSFFEKSTKHMISLNNTRINFYFQTLYLDLKTQILKFECSCNSNSNSILLVKKKFLKAFSGSILRFKLKIDSCVILLRIFHVLVFWRSMCSRGIRVLLIFYSCVKLITLFLIAAK